MSVTVYVDGATIGREHGHAARPDPLALGLPDEWNDHTPDRGPQ